MNGFLYMVRVERIELSPHPWQGRVLPLNDTRVRNTIHESSLNSKFFDLYSI